MHRWGDDPRDRDDGSLDAFYSWMVQQGMAKAALE
jgi:hypothetical protein